MPIVNWNWPPPHRIESPGASPRRKPEPACQGEARSGWFRAADVRRRRWVFRVILLVCTPSSWNAEPVRSGRSVAESDHRLRHRGRRRWIVRCTTDGAGHPDAQLAVEESRRSKPPKRIFGQPCIRQPNDVIVLANARIQLAAVLAAQEVLLLDEQYVDITQKTIDLVEAMQQQANWRNSIWIGHASIISRRSPPWSPASTRCVKRSSSCLERWAAGCLGRMDG